MRKLLIIISIFLLVGCTEDTEKNSEQIIKEIEIRNYELREDGRESDILAYSTIEKYNADGFIMETINKDSDNNIVSRSETVYDENNNRISLIGYDSINQTTWITNFTYEDNVLMEYKSFFNNELQGYSVYEYSNEYDIKITTYDSDGNIMEISEDIYETENKFTSTYFNKLQNVNIKMYSTKDKYGNIIKDRIFEDEILTTENINAYDDKGNLIKTISKNNTSVESIYEDILEYDDEGNYIVSRKYFDGVLYFYEEREIKYWK